MKRRTKCTDSSKLCYYSLFKCLYHVDKYISDKQIDKLRKCLAGGHPHFVDLHVVICILQFYVYLYVDHLVAFCNKKFHYFFSGL